jgi:glycosyltransferase involved in cell wall biosynthesis
MPKPCLLVYVEPTPYILPRIALLKSGGGLDYDAVFITRDSTQSWGLADESGARVLFEKRGGGGKRLAALLGNILRGRYSVAHLAGWGHPVLMAVIAALSLRGIPFSMESDTQLPASRRGLKELVKRLTYPWLFRRPRLLLPGGERQARFFRAFGVAPARMRKAYMTVDTRGLERMPVQGTADWRQRQGISENDTVFLYVGRLEEHKGIPQLLDAVGAVRTAGGTRWVIVGDGTLRNLVEQAAAADPRILYTGRQPTATVVQWMRASDALVLPSLFEPWGLVVNEAMCCGLPIIATDRVGAVDDLVFDGLNGIIVPVGDGAALAAAMDKLAASPDLRRNMATASRAIIQPWTTERESQVIRTAIEQLAEMVG